MISLGDRCLFGLFVSIALCEVGSEQSERSGIFQEFEDVLSRVRKTSRGGQECATGPWGFCGILYGTQVC